MTRPRSQRRLWLAALAAVAVAAGAAWLVRRPSAPGPRLVVVYATCSFNRDFISPYNPAVSYTPFLDRFAREGVVFTKHQTEEGQSGIAYASLLSGSQAMRHGVYYHPAKLSDSLYLMSEAFRDAGFETFYWANHPMASPELNFAQGIPAENAFYDGLLQYFLRADDVRFQHILAHLREDPRYRAFILTTFSLTHAPYSSSIVMEFCAAYPGECAGLEPADITRYALVFYQNHLGLQYAFDATIAMLRLSPGEVAKLTQVVTLLYKSNVFQVDRRFGAVLEAIAAAGLQDQSLVVFTADHGELVERAAAGIRWSHGFSLSADDILVPLIVRAPGVAAGRFDGVTRSIDVYPTLAGLSGIRLPPHAVTGVDLAPALRGEAPAPALAAFSHTSLLADGMKETSHAAIVHHFPRRDPALMWVAVREGDFVYKLTSEDANTFTAHVYNWTTDPTETVDLYDPQSPAHAAMLKRLGTYKTQLIDGYGYWQAVAAGRLPSERQQEILRSLGYID